MKWIKENWDGISILLVFLIIIGLGLLGYLDFIFQFLIKIFAGFTSTNNNYSPGENFPFQ